MIPILIIILLILLDYLTGMRPARLVAAYDSPEPVEAENRVKASVVALAMGMEDNPKEYIESLLAQDYPDFELILVCDCNAETASMYAEPFANNPNVHITFLPPGSRRLSRRKLALTIGIKAAKGDVVVTTSTGVRPSSPSWLTSLLAPFNSPDGASTAAAMGVIAPNPEDFRGRGGKSRIFYNQSATIQWLGAAISGTPTRCDGFNMAFRREIFFNTKGYSSSMQYVDGDDDIFLQDLHSYGGCVPVISDESILLTQWGEDSDRIATEYREQYMFTQRALKKGPYLLNAFSSWCRWLAIPIALIPVVTGIGWLASYFNAGCPWMERVIASSQNLCEGWLTAYPEGLMPQIVGGILLISLPLLLLLAYGIIEAKVFQKAARRLTPTGETSGSWLIPFRLLWRPIGNFIFRERHRSSFSNHFTYTHS